MKKREVITMAKPALWTLAPEGIYRVRLGRFEFKNLHEARKNQWEKCQAVIPCEIIEGEYKGRRIPFYDTLHLNWEGGARGIPTINEGSRLGRLLSTCGQDFRLPGPIDLSRIEGFEIFAEVQNSTKVGSTLRKVVAFYVKHPEDCF